MFTAALATISKREEQNKCSSMEEFINKIVCVSLSYYTYLYNMYFSFFLSDYIRYYT